MISFIIPAYNEEAMIGATVQRLRDSADALQMPYEIIVVDDDSSDRTAEIARQHGARIVSVKKRQIAAVRNAGAKEAHGDVLIFVDADTLVPEPPLFAAIDALKHGAIGGGAAPCFDDNVPASAKLLAVIIVTMFVWLRYAAGCFVFCHRTDFEAIGGFDERFYASEEIWISKALKKRGRFVMLSEQVITSGRKIRMHGLVSMLWRVFCLGVRGPRRLQRREGLELWYDGQRETRQPT